MTLWWHIEDQNNWEWGKFLMRISEIVGIELWWFYNHGDWYYLRFRECTKIKIKKGGHELKKLTSLWSKPLQSLFIPLPFNFNLNFNWMFLKYM